ncbi:MAG: DMT family transporter [Solirubrobacteraceae bacterium]
MSRGVAISITFAAGLLVGLQSPANSALSNHVGDFGAAFVSATVTLAAVTVVLLIAGDPGRLSGVGSIRPVELIGGLGGAAVVTAGLIAVRTLGAGAVVALLVTAQLVTSITADRLGWFGLHHVGIGAGRLAGLALVVAGTVLITRT